MDRPHFSIHRQDKLQKTLIHKIKVINAYRAMKGILGDVVDEAKALKSAAKRYSRWLGATSRHKPHQGPKECARRRLQLERGQIFDHFTRGET